MSPWMLPLPCVVLVVSLLGGCAVRSPAPATAPAGEVDPAPPAEASPRVPVPDRHWLPPLFTGVEDEVHYFISRLADRRFVDTYGGAEHPRPWYIAAERLGQIGEPAIPLLVSRLDTADEYELMLALYALMLASQDPRLMARTGGDYVELGRVLSEESNAENRAAAEAWWQRHGWRWQ